MPNFLQSSRRALVAACLVASPVAAQQSADPFVGNWQGTLNTGAVALRLGLTVRRDSSGALAGTLTSVDQGGSRGPAAITVRGDTLVASMPPIGATYTAVLSAARDSLRGTFAQGPGRLPLAMGRVNQIATLQRPQDPKPPFPYTATELTFASVPNVTLAGTLTVPNGTGPFPAVVLVSGSGPQDRDEGLMGHRPFRVIADHLARHGIASLRYDDRGTARSTGNFASATSADFADDAEAAVRFLETRPEIARDRIGIAGHSEGGLIAPMVAARTRDVAFIVLLAGPGIPGDSILSLQNGLIQRAMGVPDSIVNRAVGLNAQLFAAVKSAKDSADAIARARQALLDATATWPADLQAGARAAATRDLGQLVSPWMRYFLAYDPRAALRRVRVPVLALGGTLDLQVPYRVNLAAIDTALTQGGNRDHETIALPNLNHLFQTTKTGAPSEYATIEETFSPLALDAMTNWIVKRFVRK